MLHNMSNMDSGFILKELILMESSFRRSEKLSYDNNPENYFNVDVGVATTEESIVVSEEVKVLQNFKGEKQFDISVKMVGIFQRIGESSLTDDNEFGRINGAAIIFPFIREHIANIAMKGGLGNLLLPPVNFAKYSKE